MQSVQFVVLVFLAFALPTLGLADCTRPAPDAEKLRGFGDSARTTATRLSLEVCAYDKPASGLLDGPFQGQIDSTKELRGCREPIDTSCPARSGISAIAVTSTSSCSSSPATATTWRYARRPSRSPRLNAGIERHEASALFRLIRFYKGSGSRLRAAMCGRPQRSVFLALIREIL
jgi:hypothetical protein